MLLYALSNQAVNKKISSSLKNGVNAAPKLFRHTRFYRSRSLKTGWGPHKCAGPIRENMKKVMCGRLAAELISARFSGLFRTVFSDIRPKISEGFSAPSIV